MIGQVYDLLITKYTVFSRYLLLAANLSKL
jgi:hypothetical protein